MAYTPNTWVVGDVITAEKMNALEQAVAELSQNSGGYDAILHYYHENNSSSEGVFTIVQGSYAALSALIEENITPNVLLQYWDDMSHDRWASNATVIYAYEPTGAPPYIVFTVKIPPLYDEEPWFGATFTWNAENTVTY